MPPPLPPKFISDGELSAVVRLAPLVSIDFVIRNPKSQVLLGLRNNAPARGFYFVPGGMVMKDERIHDAFARILKRETNYSATPGDARFLGVYEHFYAENRFGEAGYGTHYVVQGYELKPGNTAALIADDQHSELRWWDEPDLLASPQVHDNTKAYFR
jgi:colanic acid biosynthesis protein WcaH